MRRPRRSGIFAGCGGTIGFVLCVSGGDEERVYVERKEMAEGVFHTMVNAPCPPMLWPVMLTRLESSWAKWEKSCSGSSSVM